MRKIFLTLTILSGLVFAETNFIKFEKQEIKIEKDGNFIYFSPEENIANANKYTQCIFTIEEKNLKTVLCQKKFSPYADVGYVSGILKNNKVIVFEPLIEVKELSLEKLK
jgi:hypothetical protein